MHGIVIASIALLSPSSWTRNVCSSSGLAKAAASVRGLRYLCNHGKASEDSWKLCHWSGFLRRRQDVAVPLRLLHHSGPRHLAVAKSGSQGCSEIALH
ncbi:hypothetical protein M758_3G020600 [Ceratodon purpureus]|uniref:Secreted protein n=1 Tax=Ceratodon purpureus TaxID=3225 RepID=A0A8T0IDV6_CERPU|nr:hypothetical protein KC19_3G020600 [Ceratodon purpureus]KAG0621448.1 hypothetical protein M758_3G020600 [Ceratodon purpureus]